MFQGYGINLRKNLQVMFNEKKLRKQLALKIEEINKKNRTLRAPLKTFVPIILSVCTRGEVFKAESAVLNNLEYNAFMVFLMQRLNNIDTIDADLYIEAVKNAIRDTKTTITGIENAAKKIKIPKQRDAYYKLMNSNHLFIANISIVRSYVWTDIIHALYPYYATKKLNKISSSKALDEILELTGDGECSRLQKVLDIITNNTGKFTRCNELGEKESNLDTLGLSEEDIESLHLFTSVNYKHLSMIIKKIYNSINIESTKDGDFDKIIVLKSLFFFLENSSNFAPIDVSYCESEFKYALYNSLQSCDNWDVVDFLFTIQETLSLKKIKGFSSIKFKTNVGDNYVKTIKPNLDPFFIENNNQARRCQRPVAKPPKNNRTAKKLNTITPGQETSQNQEDSPSESTNCQPTLVRSSNQLVIGILTIIALVFISIIIYCYRALEVIILNLFEY
ncbi:hypothetical protein NEPAR06_1444 [Nematocida parisii]|uniref:Uncharacterized protein n=1 Tax=Nematocida parisii (strain ERTm3) TaxID=935791 RepID=I3EEG8_NEMP3|nr:uncharacterized protein NEPG_02242 [Nematocida parisii ERTm1]EIJ87615.1 hypothetical protein NEQG_02162 [Nematocida parisii ERTm3]KAI5126690.1 hypothetical protein NEPAR03_0611 [Nematocida parisii]EIJ92843.1 hypothetical protein NEPG_02242 [Nematocida parisii ERTm1]KAI5129292.1 hypothetical protein NEPAR08_1536 [Nematocida parisii]KAI5142038.1 hypothetical protein NEPAR04_1394 [Nematocida parisii]|eukprot:XP_013060069.1 hypothetical protein NEPG_02242 [Nematocida parisii ERTm1]